MIMWDGWPLGRVVLLFTGLAFFMITIQVTIYHYRQNFRHWTMYSPVMLGPVLGLFTLMLAFLNILALQSITVVLLLIGVVSGLTGAALHTNGIGQRVGGFGEGQNYLVGPPLILPLMLSAISVLGLLAIYWR